MFGFLFSGAARTGSSRTGEPRLYRRGNIRGSRFVPWIVSGLLLSFIGVGFGAAADALWEKRREAQRAWQEDLAQFLIAKDPKITELAEIQRDLQLTLVEIQSRRYYYVLEHEPARIRRDQGVYVWINFPWTEDDEESLSKTDSDYRALLERKKDLQQKNDGHPLWPEMRKVFAEAEQDREYKRLIKKLMDTQQEIGEALK